MYEHYNEAIAALQLEIERLELSAGWERPAQVEVLREQQQKVRDVIEQLSSLGRDASYYEMC